MNAQTTPTPSRRHRRGTVRAALAGAAALGLLGLAACGSPPTTSGSGAGRSSGGGEAKVSAKDCPIAALDEAKGPVKVNMWFSGLVDPPLSVLTNMVKAYNASQDKVVVTANNQ